MCASSWEKWRQCLPRRQVSISISHRACTGAGIWAWERPAVAAGAGLFSGHPLPLFDSSDNCRRRSWEPAPRASVCSLSHPHWPAGVKLAAAKAVPGPIPGSKRLVGYVTPASVDSAAVLEHCRARLITAMLPSALVPLDAFPLLPNGKVDVAALPPPPEPGPEDCYAAPADEVRGIRALRLKGACCSGPAGACGIPASIVASATCPAGPASPAVEHSRHPTRPCCPCILRPHAGPACCPQIASTA